MSNKIEIDLTQNLANVGVEMPFFGEFTPDGNLLVYPNATLDKVVVDLGVTFTKPDVQVVGEIICCVQGYCDRCLDKVSKKFELSFDQTFYKDSTDDPDGYVYYDSVLDATKAVCDEIVLSLPMSLLCSDECKGLCPKCGTNLNKHSCNCDTTKENVFSVLKNLKF